MAFDLHHFIARRKRGNICLAFTTIHYDPVNMLWNGPQTLLGAPRLPQPTISITPIINYTAVWITLAFHLSGQVWWILRHNTSSQQIFITVPVAVALQFKPLQIIFIAWLLKCVSQAWHRGDTWAHRTPLLYPLTLLLLTVSTLNSLSHPLSCKSNTLRWQVMQISHKSLRCKHSSKRATHRRHTRWHNDHLETNKQLHSSKAIAPFHKCYAPHPSLHFSSLPICHKFILLHLTSPPVLMLPINHRCCLTLSIFPETQGGGCCRNWVRHNLWGSRAWLVMVLRGNVAISAQREIGMMGRRL